MTNAEKIREMTDEELAQNLPTGDCYCCPIGYLAASDDSIDTSTCYGCALGWLKREEIEK